MVTSWKCGFLSNIFQQIILLAIYQVSIKTTAQIPEWVNDESCDKEHDGKDSKHNVTELVVLAVLG